MTDLFEGALSARDRLRLVRHLARCDGCRTYVAQLRAVIRLLGSSGGSPGG